MVDTAGNTVRLLRGPSDAYLAPYHVSRSQIIVLERGLVRAADLIGPLGDPLYPRKLNALFYEFAEIGINQRLGSADVANNIPRFFLEQG